MQADADEATRKYKAELAQNKALKKELDELKRAQKLETGRLVAGLSYLTSCFTARDGSKP